MRRAAILAAIAIAGCSKNEPERGVDTTLPSEPAKITGSLVAPNEYMPDDLTVCAETLDGKTAHCDANVTKSVFSGSYSLTLPPGAYRVYARTNEVPNFKAYYTACTSSSNCPTHSPIIVNLKEGEERDGVDPVDWFNRPMPASPAYDGSDVGSDMNVDENLTTTDMNETSVDE